jgi:Domain of unknown function (DUF4258)
MGFDPLGKQISRLRISDHGYDEMSDENILAKEVLAGVFEGIVVEDYPSYGKGPCVLVLQKDLNQQPIHVVWGIPKDLSSPAVVVTAYRPNPERITANNVVTRLGATASAVF